MHLRQHSTRTTAPSSRHCSAKRYVAVCIRRSTHCGHDSSKVSAWSGATNASPSTNKDGETVLRQTYIQESMNFTGAELAARLDSMQARLRAQRAPAATVPSTAAGGSRVAAATPASVRNATYAATTAAYTIPMSPAVDATAASTASSSSDQLSSTQVESPSTENEFTRNGSSGTYSNSTLQGLSASEKLRALQQVQQVSRQALQQVSTPVSPYYVNAPKTIDVRMYDQLVNAHNKLSRKLGESNAHIEVLQEQVDRCNEDLMAAFELLKQIAMEFGTTSRLAASTAAAVQFGVDPQDALDKIGKLQDRLSTLEQAVLEQRQEFGLRVVRKVPVEWVGVASEVRIMGDFDGWTRGHELSAEDVTSDSVFSRFESTLMLRPGCYRVKFLVDNEWRQAADWPTEVDSEGNTVNVLTVA